MDLKGRDKKKKKKMLIFILKKVFNIGDAILLFYFFFGYHIKILQSETHVRNMLVALAK